MNTAEAIAACLYIAGFKDLARVLLDPFGYDILNRTAFCFIYFIYFIYCTFFNFIPEEIPPV
jgi:hypothetical protein